jgi:hypothetical protein
MTAYRDDNHPGLALAISDKGRWPPIVTDLKSYYKSIVDTETDTVFGMDEEMHAARLALIHARIEERFLESLKAEVHDEYVTIALVLTFYKSELNSRNSISRIYKHRDLLIKQIRKDYEAAGWEFVGAMGHDEKCVWPFLGKKERHKFTLDFHCSPLE